MLRLATFLIAVLVLSPWALGQHLISGDVDPQTGEPIPLGGTPPDSSAPDGVRGGGEPLDVLAHLAEGSTKLVRSVNSTLVLYQNGADLVAATVVREIGLPPVYTEVGRFRLEAQPTDMVIVGTLAFVSLQKGKGLLVLDVSDPASITRVGQLEGESLFAVEVDGAYAYVGRGTAGLAVYDISDLSAITEAVALDTPGSANGLDVSGTVLHVADGNSSSGPDYRTYDISDPTNPQLLGTYEAGSFVTYVDVVGTRAFLTGGFGLRILDVSDPTQPAFLGEFDAGGETAYEVIARTNGAFVVRLGGAFAVDVIDPTNPFAFQSNTNIGQGLSVAEVEGVGLVADRFEGLRLLDVTLLGGSWLPEFERIENGGFSHKGTFDGDYLYVTDLAGTLRIIDLGAALPGGTGPVREVGRIDVPPNTQEVLVQDGIAYVSDADSGGSGLTILDVSDPANPTVLGQYGSSNQAFGMDLVGTTLFLANGFTGLQTLDVTDPANPTPLGSFPMSSNTNDVDVDAEGTVPVAYVTNFGGGMYSLDVSDPRSIRLLGVETDWSFLNAIDLLDHPDYGLMPYAGVADAQAGLRIIYIDDPAALESDLPVPVQTQPRDVVMSWGSCKDHDCPNAWVADDFFGMQYFIALNFPFGTFASADRGIGVAVLQNAINGYKDIAALMAGETGVYFFKSPIPVSAELGAPQGSPSLSAVTPNPAQDGATVRYTLPETSPVRLAVYDLLGREIAVLAQGAQPSGAHEVRFDTAGLPNGVYVIRLQTGDRVFTTKATVVR